MIRTFRHGADRLLTSSSRGVRPSPTRSIFGRSLSDISRNDPVVMTQLAALSGVELEYAVTDALFTTGWALHFDWRERAEIIVPAVDRLFAKLGVAVLDPATQHSIHQMVASCGRHRILKTEIDLVYGPLCEELEARELRFLDVNRGGDDLYLSSSPAEDVYRRWVDTKFSAGFAVEDPGWQFASKLMGTPYQRFAHHRWLRRPGEPRS